MTIHLAAPTLSLADDLAARIEARTARVAVVGMGHPGLSLAETFAWAGFPVIGYDFDPHKVAEVERGEGDIGGACSERIAELTGGDRFEATTDPVRFVEADAILICVPTPLGAAREPDLSCIIRAAEAIRPHLRAGQLVVLESSTYPGTTEDLLRPLLEESGLKAGQDFFLAYSPQREDPGNPDLATRNVPKVVGGLDETSLRLAVALYEPVVDGVVPVSSTRVAEACKALESTYRCVNIALVNELKGVFAALGIDVWEVIEAASTKPFGFQAFYPGPGLGGHGVPVGPFYLAWAARRHGVSTRCIDLAGEMNTAMPRQVVDRVAEALNDEGKQVKGSRVCVLGVAYKKDVHDTDASPAYPILQMLHARGAIVSYNDPHVPSLPPLRHHRLRLESQPLTPDLLGRQDCVLILTDHSAYDWQLVARHARLVVDTRNALVGCALGSARVVKA